MWSTAQHTPTDFAVKAVAVATDTFRATFVLIFWAAFAARVSLATRRTLLGVGRATTTASPVLAATNPMHAFDAANSVTWQLHAPKRFTTRQRQLAKDTAALK